MSSPEWANPGGELRLGSVRFWWPWLAALACFAIAALAARSALADAGTQRAFRIVALGSSSTEGIGATEAAATYPAQLERLLRDGYHDRISVSALNRGVAGEDASAMLRRLDRDVLASKPDLVIWQVGSNDCLKGVPIDRFKADLRIGIAAIRAGGAEVMLMDPQWSPVIDKAHAASRFVDAVQTIAADQHVDVVHRFALMQQWVAEGVATRASLIGPDGLHMTDEAYAMLAKAAFDQIVERSQAFRKRLALIYSGSVPTRGH